MIEPPVCLPCEKFAEYDLRLNLWTCPLCGRRVTDEEVADSTPATHDAAN